MIKWITLYALTHRKLVRFSQWLRRKFRPTPTELLRDRCSRLGRLGEDAAVRHLENAGYDLLCRNYRPPHGVGEIDIVVRDTAGVLCFVEVKTRRVIPGRPRPNPHEAVNAHKRKRIIRSASAYLRSIEAKEASPKFRFDIVEVWVTNGSPNLLRHWTDAFTQASQYRSHRN